MPATIDVKLSFLLQVGVSCMAAGKILVSRFLCHTQQSDL